MKKLIYIIFLFGIILLPNKTYANETVSAQGSNQQLYLNDKNQNTVGFNIDDYNYYRLRDLASMLKTENFNFSLWGDDKEIKVTMYKKYNEDETPKVINKVGEKKTAIKKPILLTLTKNDNTTSQEILVYNIDGYNYFRLRDIGAILGFDVDYNEVRNEAQIFTRDFERKPVETTKKVILGNERLLEDFSYLVDGKKVGLITNQTGIDSKGIRTVDKLFNHNNSDLIAIYSPEHGLDGLHKAGEYVESYTDTQLNLPVFSLYGKTREPSKEMLKGIDVLIFDIQDIGSRTYTYVSTMNYAMKAAKKAGIEIVVLDRPNPVGGEIVEGFVLEDKYKTFVGVDNTPMAHGMTAGELANFYNRNINAKLTVVPMENYKRSMIWQDTNLPFAQTSPNIPDITSAFNYMATGIGDGTGLGQGYKFAWVGSKTLNSEEYARKLNSYNLPGVIFTPEDNKDRGGVRLRITDYHKYNPQKTGTYILATANLLGDINIPREINGEIPMFEKIHGTNKMGRALLNKQSPEEIIESYQDELDEFKEIRKNYLIYD